MQNGNTQNNPKAPRRKNKITALATCLFLSFTLTGCSSPPDKAIDGQTWQESWTQIGNFMGADAPEPLTLLDNKETLAADGLYYAAWATGDSVPYENDDGEIVDLYDAQLYLLASETNDEKSAEKNYQTWLSAAKNNYDVLAVEDITCNGQSYTFITYNCIGDNSPYDHGVSAIGVHGAHAVCAELTCVEGYEENLTSLLKKFLDNCHYR